MATMIGMPSRLFIQSALSRSIQSSKPFHSSRQLLDVVTAAPIKVRKPVGAFRGGIFGFLFGSVTAGAGMFYYVMEEYRVSNELLTEDIYALQRSAQRIQGYVASLEERLDAMERKKKA